MASRKQKLKLVETVDSCRYDEEAKRYFIDTAAGRHFSVSKSLGQQQKSRLVNGAQVTLSIDQADSAKLSQNERVHATALQFPKSSETATVRTREG